MSQWLSDQVYTKLPAVRGYAILAYNGLQPFKGDLDGHQSNFERFQNCPEGNQSDFDGFQNDLKGSLIDLEGCLDDLEGHQSHFDRLPRTGE